MRKLMVGLGLAAMVTVGAGASVAQTSGTPGTTPPATTMPHDPASMQAMHEQMKDGMPADLRAKCDEMHASMQGHMGNLGAHMAGGGMMGH
jgi:hypothetical protein